VKTGDQTLEADMGPAVRHRLATGFLAGLAALSSLVVAVVVVVNLHIFTGVVDGYMASPAQVVEHSVLLAVIDVLLLVAAPVLAVVVVVRLRAERSGPR
jgi:ABC-type antimicrobial peptide transport system permease subunit